MPGVLGAELLAVEVVSGIALLILDRRTGHATDQGVARHIERLSPTRSPRISRDGPSCSSTTSLMSSP